MYFTKGHEWIEYRGYIALVGVCKIKLSGINNIQSVEFCDILSPIGLGSVIATLQTEHRAIEVYMPVEGKIIDFNKKLLENPSLIVTGENISVWIVKISPNAPYKRDGLLQPHQYKSLKKKANGTING